VHIVAYSRVKLDYSSGKYNPYKSGESGVVLVESVEVSSKAMGMTERSEKKSESIRDRDLDNIVAVIAWMLEREGYNTRRHYVIEGAAGIKHVVDILAEKEPLPRAHVRIAIWVHKGKLTVDSIEAYIARKTLLPVDKVVVIVLGDIEPDAYSLARSFDIDVLNFSKDLAMLKEMRRRGVFRELFVQPMVEEQEAVKILRSKVKPGFFRRRVCRPEGYAAVYIPLVVIELEMPIRRYGEEEITLEEVALAFDGVAGYVLVASNGSIDIEESMGSFSDISEECIEVLRYLAKHGTISISELATITGVSEVKLKTILDMLAAKSLVDIFGDLVELRYSLLESSSNPLNMIKSRGAEVKLGLPESEGVVIPLKANVARLTELVEALQGKIVNTNIVYYPLYALSCRENEHQIRIVAIDGLTGEESGLVKLLSMREILNLITAHLKKL